MTGQVNVWEKFTQKCYTYAIMPDKMSDNILERRKKVPLTPNVIFLGVVSFLNDVSSEMIFSLMPLFLSNVLGVATMVIGLIEGIAECTASLLKLLSGWVSDTVGRRKELAFIGYALSTFAKPVMLMANTWVHVLGVRFVDRLGKGIRVAPRDALLSDSVDEFNRGRAYGFHKAMDTGGAALGLILAAIVVWIVQKDSAFMSFNTYQWLIILGIVPSFIALFCFIGINEPRKRYKGVPPYQSMEGSSCGDIEEQPGAMGTKFKIFMIVMFLFTLGNSSDAFIVLRAQNLGNSVLLISLMLIMFNIVYALFSMPAGILSDKLGRRKVIIAGWVVYALVYLGLALSNQPWMIWVLFAFYGLYYGMTQGVYRALVCDLVPEGRRGTAFGYYNGIVGITLLPASLLAGWLWETINPAAPFYFGAVMAGVAAIGLILFVRE